jgi:ribosomal protein S18 acetylase RimI-like enzyme
MSKYQIAEINIARIRGVNIHDPIMKEFMDNLDIINALAEHSDGFVWRLKDDENNAISFNPYDDEQVIINISVWQRIELLENFVFKSLHTDFLRRRKEWFQNFGTISTAMWWIETERFPTVIEAVDKLSYLQKNGATDLVFDFKNKFPPPDAFPINITKADAAKEFELGKILFEEYAGSLNFDLGYQDFEKELNNLSQQYKEPDGALLLCFIDNEIAVGCAGVRKFSDEIAELKRLYVKPDYRNLKIGKRILVSAIDIARRLNYKFIRLDTVPGQEKAQELYHYLGFYEIEPYRYSPVDGTIYFEKRLTEN